MNRHIEIIRKLALKHGWKEIDCQEKIGMISFSKNDMRTNVYYRTMTVATCLNHYKYGKTQMFRRNVPMGLLSRIFKYPRVHTKKHEPYHGYRRIKDR